MSDMEQLTFSLEEAPANPSPSQGAAQGSKARADLCGSSVARSKSSSNTAGEGRLDTYSGRTFQELSQAAPKARRGRISDACSESWKSAGMVWHGEFWTASLPEYQTGQRLDSQGRYRNAAGASSLSEVLVATAPAKYSLSARACEGIIRRAEKRGKPLPEILRAALEWVIARDSSTTKEAQRGGSDTR